MVVIVALVVLQFASKRHCTRDCALNIVNLNRFLRVRSARSTVAKQ